MALTRKREARKSLQQRGWIFFDGGFAARPCTVQDMSTTGAKILIDDPNSLPARLRLASWTHGRHQVHPLAATAGKR
jgi:hypothetical protein